MITIATTYSAIHAEPGYDIQKPLHIDEGTPDGTATDPTTWDTPWVAPIIRIYSQLNAGITGSGIQLDYSYTD